MTQGRLSWIWSPTTWRSSPNTWTFSAAAPRLKILKPSSGVQKSIRQISAAIETSYENTKKHLDRLMMIGVVRKEAGLSRPTARGVGRSGSIRSCPAGLRPSQGVSGSCKPAADSHRRGSGREAGQCPRDVSGEFGRLSSPAVILLGGPEDGKVFPLDHDRIAIGRLDPAAGAHGARRLSSARGMQRSPASRGRTPGSPGIATTAGSSRTAAAPGGTFVNGRLLEEGRRHELHDGDMIDLAKGASGATLVFVAPVEGYGAG